MDPSDHSATPDPENPAAPTRLEVGVLSGMLVGGVLLLAAGIRHGCVFTGIAGGLLVGGSLVVLMFAAHTSSPVESKQITVRLPTVPTSQHDRSPRRRRGDPPAARAHQ